MIPNALTLYILFSTTSQDALITTTVATDIATALTQDYAGMTSQLELRIYDEQANGDLTMGERIPFPVCIDGVFVTETAQQPMPEEPDYGIWDTDFEEQQETEDEDDTEQQLLPLSV